MENTVSMNEFIVIAHYLESDWGDDIIRFRMPNHVRNVALMDEIERLRGTYSSANYDSLQDYADMIFTRTAETLGGTWEYVAQCGVVDIGYDEEESE